MFKNIVISKRSWLEFFSFYVLTGWQKGFLQICLSSHFALFEFYVNLCCCLSYFSLTNCKLYAVVSHYYSKWLWWYFYVHKETMTTSYWALQCLGPSSHTEQYSSKEIRHAEQHLNTASHRGHFYILYMQRAPMVTTTHNENCIAVDLIYWNHNHSFVI